MEIEKVSFPNRKPFSEDYFRKLYQKYPEGFIVARDKGKILGYAVGEAQKDCGKIISIAVHPAWRKKGVGKGRSDLPHFYLRVARIPTASCGDEGRKYGKKYIGREDASQLAAGSFILTVNFQAKDFLVLKTSWLWGREV